MSAIPVSGRVAVSTALPAVTTPRLVAGLAVLQVALFAVPMVVLGRAIGWPASLRLPASEALPLVAANLQAVLFGYWAYLLVSVAMVPLAFALRSLAAERGRSGPMIDALAFIGAAAGILKTLGIVRWLSAMPALATAHAGADAAGRATIETAYLALNTYAGSVGELLGGDLEAGGLGELGGEALLAQAGAGGALGETDHEHAALVHGIGADQAGEGLGGGGAGGLVVRGDEVDEVDPLFAVEGRVEDGDGQAAFGGGADVGGEGLVVAGGEEDGLEAGGGEVVENADLVGDLGVVERALPLERDVELGGGAAGASLGGLPVGVGGGLRDGGDAELLGHGRGGGSGGGRDFGRFTAAGQQGAEGQKRETERGTKGIEGVHGKKSGKLGKP